MPQNATDDLASQEAYCRDIHSWKVITFYHGYVSGRRGLCYTLYPKEIDCSCFKSIGELCISWVWAFDHWVHRRNQSMMGLAFDPKTKHVKPCPMLTGGPMSFSSKAYLFYIWNFSRLGTTQWVVPNRAKLWIFQSDIFSTSYVPGFLSLQGIQCTQSWDVFILRATTPNILFSLRMSFRDLDYFDPQGYRTHLQGYKATLRSIRPIISSRVHPFPRKWEQRHQKNFKLFNMNQAKSRRTSRLDSPKNDGRKSLTTFFYSFQASML